MFETYPTSQRQLKHGFLFPPTTHEKIPMSEMSIQQPSPNKKSLETLNDYWRGHYITNPNNARFKGKSFKITSKICIKFDDPPSHLMVPFI